MRPLYERRQLVREICLSFVSRTSRKGSDIGLPGIDMDSTNSYELVAFVDGVASQHDEVYYLVRNKVDVDSTDS
jgi:hypothetical protein